MNVTLKGLRLRRTPEKDQRLDSPDESQETEASGDAIVIATSIHDLADAIREHARAMRGEDTEVDDGQFDLAGNRV